MESRTLVINIDETICLSVVGEYEKAKLIKKKIEFINLLFEQGNTILFLTARGMRSSDNDIDVAKKRWFSFTVNQLHFWGVKYHLLYFGKSAGDLYIDVKAISDLVFFS